LATEPVDLVQTPFVAVGLLPREHDQESVEKADAAIVVGDMGVQLDHLGDLLVHVLVRPVDEIEEDHTHLFLYFEVLKGLRLKEAFEFLLALVAVVFLGFS